MSGLYPNEAVVTDAVTADAGYGRPVVYELRFGAASRLLRALATEMIHADFDARRKAD